MKKTSEKKFVSASDYDVKITRTKNGHQVKTFSLKKDLKK